MPKSNRQLFVFLSILNPSLISTPDHAMPSMKLSLDKIWGGSILACQDLQKDIGSVFKIATVKEVTRILVKMPYDWQGDVFKYVCANVSTVFCIKTSEDMEVMMAGACVQ